MQNATIESEVIIEYITNAQGRKVKKLKPLLIKSEPDRGYTQHIQSDDNLPKVPEDNFMQKREVTVDSYSETISSDSSSDDRTITTATEDSISSMEDNIEEKFMYKRQQCDRNRSFITPNSFWTTECCRRIYVLSFTYF